MKGEFQLHKFIIKTIIINAEHEIAVNEARSSLKMHNIQVTKEHNQ